MIAGQEDYAKIVLLNGLETACSLALEDASNVLLEQYGCAVLSSSDHRNHGEDEDLDKSTVWQDDVQRQLKHDTEASDRQKRDNDAADVAESDGS